MLKDQRLAQWGQKLGSSTAVLATDGRSKLTSTEEKLKQWRQRFEEVCKITTDVLERVLDTTPEARPQGADGNNGDGSLCCEPREDEIRAAIKLLKNGKAPGVHMITAELLKLGEETVVQWLTQLAVSIWQSERVPED